MPVCVKSGCFILPVIFFEHSLFKPHREFARLTKQPMHLSPDLILHNARVYTVDAANPWSSAVAIRKGEIVAVGPSDEVLALADSHTTLHDLEQRLVLPGMCDSHIHFYDWSLAQTEVTLYETASKREMLERIRERSQSSGVDSWIIGRGWNESWWGDTEYPTADDLDSVTGPKQPAIFWRTDMHAAVVNHTALRLAGIDASTMNPTGGVIVKDASGEPTGVLKELAVPLVSNLIPEKTEGERIDAIRRGVDLLHTLGVTAVHDQRMKDGNEGTLALSAYQRIDAEKCLKLRINCNVAAHQLPHLSALGLHSGFGNDQLRLGHVKLFADGSLGSQTALMMQPFVKDSPGDPDNTGVRLTEPEEIAEVFDNASRLGFPISIHAIGDRANHEVLDLFEELCQRVPPPPVPHRIEHVQTIQPDDLPRLAELNITASVQPIHATDDMDLADRILGARGANLYNFATLLEHGTLLAFGSDGPVADVNPFAGIHAALYRQRPSRMAAGSWYGDECITLEQAIYAYTMAPALATGWQDVIGSIEPGKRADMVVLDRDLFEIVGAGVTGNEVSGTQVVMTIFDGEVTIDRR